MFVLVGPILHSNLFAVDGFVNGHGYIVGGLMEIEKTKLLEQHPLIIGSPLKIKLRYGGCTSVEIPKAVDEDFVR